MTQDLLQVTIISASEKTWSYSCASIYAGDTMKKKIPQGDMEWVNGCQWLTVIVILYRILLQQCSFRFVCWDQQKCNRKFKKIVIVKKRAIFIYQLKSKGRGTEISI